MIDQYQGFFRDDHAWAMPVVAETYDGLTNDICGRHIKEEHVLNALDSAASGFIAEGNVGGGTGMATYEFKGGTGTASRRVQIGSDEYTVGILVQSNFGARQDLNILGVPIGRHWPENAVMGEITPTRNGLHYCDHRHRYSHAADQLRRVAKRAAIGIGRTGTPGGNYSGDIFLAFSVANDLVWPGMHAEQPAAYALEFVNDHYFDEIYRAVVQAIEEAVVNAMIAAESMTTVKPAGYTLEAIDHDRLIKIMSQYHRL